MSTASSPSGEPHWGSLPRSAADAYRNGDHDSDDRDQEHGPCDGEDVALVYLLALGTGLRRGELRRLRWQDVDFERARLSVPAASATSRRDQTVDLHPTLVAALRDARPVDALPSATVVPPRALPNSVTFDADVEAAGIPKIDPSGRVCDFHALRHTAITWVARAGNTPSRVVQAVGRHASLRTTERYLDLHLFDTKGAVARMPLPRSAQSDVVRLA